MSRWGGKINVNENIMPEQSERFFNSQKNTF